jgi:hypothetical protein
LTSRRWISDRSRSAAVVIGNHPISVVLAKLSYPFRQTCTIFISDTHFVPSPMCRPRGDLRDYRNTERGEELGNTMEDGRLLIRLEIFDASSRV